jgi:hypothetical protein
VKHWKQTIKADAGGEITIAKAEEKGKDYLFINIEQGNLNGVHLTRHEIKRLMMALTDYLWEEKQLD